MFKIRLYIMIYKNILRKLIIVSPVRWRRRLMRRPGLDIAAKSFIIWATDYLY